MMQRVQWTGGQNQDVSRGVALVTDKRDVMQCVWYSTMCVMWFNVCDEQAARIKMQAEELL